jgi:hypothetical protein
MVQIASVDFVLRLPPQHIVHDLFPVLGHHALPSRLLAGTHLRTILLLGLRLLLALAKGVD